MSITWVGNEAEALTLLRAPDLWDTLTRCIKGLPCPALPSWDSWQVDPTPPPDALHAAMVVEHRCLRTLRGALAVTRLPDGRELLRRTTDVEEFEELVFFFHRELEVLAAFIQKPSLDSASPSGRVLQQGLFLAGICTEGHRERLVKESMEAVDAALSRVQAKLGPPRRGIMDGGLDIQRAALAYDLFRPDLRGLFASRWQEWSVEVSNLWHTASALATLSKKE